MTTASPALLVPPVRLGRLLGEIRQAHGESLADLVRRCGLAFDEAFFAELEAGRAELDEPLVRWVTELYGVATSDLLPARSELIIDLTEGHAELVERGSAGQRRQVGVVEPAGEEGVEGPAGDG